MQYDRIGDDNANIPDDYDGYIDLFGWGTGDNPTLASEDNVDYATFTDWGTKIDDGNVWQTLSADEWAYIIKNRENASEKYGVAEVAGVQGLILLPDGWSLPVGLSFNSGVANDYGEEYYKTINNYSAEEWQTMESSGAVFLPAAGNRFRTFVNVVGYFGGYWSSTAYDADHARDLYFRSDGVSWYGYNRHYGFSVRLVRSL